MNESSTKVWIEGFCFIENYWDLHILICSFDYFQCISLPICVCMDDHALLLYSPITFSTSFLMALFGSYFILKMNA